MEWQFDLCGGHLALDFANTVSERESGAPVERIRGYGDLVSFARQTHLLDAARAAALLARAAKDPRAAARAHARALVMREAMYDAFAAVARGEVPSAAAVRGLDQALGRLCLGPDLELIWRDPLEALDGFMGAVALAAVKLATVAAERERVRMCEAPDCVWLFYDASRNHSRRWCDMRQCGNRMKARRHQARRKTRRTTRLKDHSQTEQYVTGPRPRTKAKRDRQKA